MAGLVPAIHVLLPYKTYYLNPPMPGGWVYLIINKRDGILFAGVTGDLPRRALEHREFCRAD